MRTEEFSAYQKAWEARNSDCRRQYFREWHQKNKTRRRVRAKERYHEVPEIYTAKAKRTRDAHKTETNIRLRLRNHKITREQYDFLVQSADGKCSICRKKFVRQFHIDHDHDTGKIRELLCNRCNLGIGYFDEDVAILMAALRYLQKHKTVESQT